VSMPAILIAHLSESARTVFLEAGYAAKDPAAQAFAKLMVPKIKEMGDIADAARFMGIKIGTVYAWVRRSNTRSPVHSHVSAKHRAMADLYSKGATEVECADKFGVTIGGVRQIICDARRKHGTAVVPYKRADLKVEAAQ